MIYEFIVFGSLLFWAGVGLFVVLACLFLECEQPGRAIFLALVALVALTCFSDVHAYEWVLSKPYTALGIVVAYFAGMGLWMLAKWELYVGKAVRKVEELKKRYFALSNAAPSGFSKWLSSQSEFYSKEIPFKVSQHKALIIQWGIWWPVSMAWTVVNDPVVRFSKYLYESLSTFMQRRSDARFAVVLEPKK